MFAVVNDAEDLIRSRRAAGLDRYDEIIKGVYYTVPPASGDHGTRQSDVYAHIRPLVTRASVEAGVGFPEDYVIPDVVAFRSDGSKGVYTDPADVLFVVEIRSDSNVGPNWERKLERLAEWNIPVAIYEGDELSNASDLPDDVAEMLPE